MLQTVQSTGYIKRASTPKQPSTLLHLATQINNKYGDVSSNYIELGKLLIIARERVKKETNYKWTEWCKNYLRKGDGTAFSQKTIENYIYLAANPKRVDNQKKMQRDNLRKIRKKAHGIETADAVVSLFTKHTSVQDQVNILMTAWEYATQTAQEQFLDLIGARM